MESEEGTMVLANRTTLVLEELEALFKYITSTKLLTFRQVSKESNEAIKLVLRKRRDIRLFLTTDNFDGRCNSKFLQFLNNSPRNVFVAPVLHIEIAGIVNRSKCKWDSQEGKLCMKLFEIIREICKRLGNRGIIKKLSIDGGENAPHFTSDFITLICPLSSLETLEISELELPTVYNPPDQENPKFQLPSLKQIKFGYAYDCDLDEAADYLKILLESSPNLERISITDSRCDEHELDIISMLRDTGRLSKMKEVVIIKPEDLEILLQCKPKMTPNSFIIKCENVDPKKLFAFLQQQAKNLKSFVLGWKCLPAKSIFTLPLLPALENLSWSSDCFLSVNYGRQTPALKSLQIFSKDNFHSWEEFLCYEVSSEMTPCSSLEEIKLYMDGKTHPEVFDSWKNLFPNVKKLNIHGPDEFDFDEAGKCWPNLEELQLNVLTGYSSYPYDCKYKDLDEIVFGISPDWRKKIDMKEDEWWMNIPAPEITGTVASFKNLRKLEVFIEGVGEAACLTDAAVYFGLRHMLNLKEIAIIETLGKNRGEKVKDVSIEAFNFLVKNLSKLEKLSLVEQNWVRR